MNYKIVKTDGIEEYTVVETYTDQNIKKFDTHKAARALMRHLNMGGGFDGNTPPFFLK